MAGYDPQKDGARPRPAVDDPSPVDELLGDAPETEAVDDEPASAAVASEPALRVAPVPAEEAPLADYRNMGIAALLALVLLYLLRKRR